MSRILDDKIQIELNEQKYQARFDLLCVAELQYYLKTRGCPMTVPQIFEGIQNEDYFVICNLLAFAIKSCNPSLKLVDLYYNMKFANRSEVQMAVINLINASMPKNENEGKDESDLPAEQKENEGK